MDPVEMATMWMEWWTTYWLRHLISQLTERFYLATNSRAQPFRVPNGIAIGAVL